MPGTTCKLIICSAAYNGAVGAFYRLVAGNLLTPSQVQAGEAAMASTVSALEDAADAETRIAAFQAGVDAFETIFEALP